VTFSLPGSKLYLNNILVKLLVHWLYLFRKRGCIIVSICCFCMKETETSLHLFFNCPITLLLWDWLGKGTDQVLDCTNCLQLILGVRGIKSKLVQQTMISAVLHIIWAIWIERNQRHFHDKAQAMSTLFNKVLAEVKLSYSLNLVNGNSAMVDYKVAALFNIPFKVQRTTPTLEVVWQPPSAGVTKFNCDGSSTGSHPCGSIGVVIRDSHATFLGAISSNIGHATPLEAEFCACMIAMEKAKAMNLNHIHLETDSMSVVKAFNTAGGVPWQMRARWLNCMAFCSSIISTCTHVLREGNMAADTLAKNGQGLSLYSTQWWHSAPPFLYSYLSRDSLGLPFTSLAVI
jgi:ribonuclease HI